CPSGGAVVPGEHGLSVGYQPKSSFPIAQEPCDLLLQRIWIAHLYGRLVCDERLGERGKIFHVRTEENGFAGQDRLDRVLSAVRGETLPDKHNRGDGVPMLELAGGIEEETVGRRRTRAAGFAAQAN